MELIESGNRKIYKDTFCASTVWPPSSMLSYLSAPSLADTLYFYYLLTSLLWQDFKPLWAEVWFPQLAESLEMRAENKCMLHNLRSVQCVFNSVTTTNLSFPQHFIEHIISSFKTGSLQGEDMEWVTNLFKNHRKENRMRVIIYRK